jgi:hypothetical protein
MDKDKILSMLNSVGCVRMKGVPLISHFQRDFHLNWQTAKRWFEILESIPLNTVDGSDFRYDKEVSKYSPKHEDREEFRRREADEAGMREVLGEKEFQRAKEKSNDNRLPDGSFVSAKVGSKVISVNDNMTGYGRVTKITQNQFGDYLFHFELEDGTLYELSEFHLR